MRISKIARRLCNRSVVTAAILALVGAQTGLAATAPSGPSFGPSAATETHTPIKHVIIIIGENWSFDSVFATYQPKAGETVLNLLSQGIVKADGTPGASYSKSKQSSATDNGTYQLAPPTTPYVTLPPFHVGGGADKFGTPFGCAVLEIALTPPATDCNTPANVAAVMPFENGLSLTPANAGGPVFYQYLLTGGTGQTSGGNTSSTLVPDARVDYDGQDASALPHGSFQLTQKAACAVHALRRLRREPSASPLPDVARARLLRHAAATATNPSGCRADLFPWVESTVSSGSNGKAQPAGWIGEGSTAMAFFNVQAGDAPYLKVARRRLHDERQLSSGGPRRHRRQPHHAGHRRRDLVQQRGGRCGSPAEQSCRSRRIRERRCPAIPPLCRKSKIRIRCRCTNNFYTQDGYGGGGNPIGIAPNANYGGGSYVNCADTTQHGVGAVDSYLAALSPSIKPNCEAGHYYLVNNYNPGYFGDGKNAYLDTNPNNYVFTIPPSNVRNIGNELSDTKISWAYFGDQFNQYLADPYQLNFAPYGTGKDNYCNICNWAQYNTAIMTDPASRNLHLHDTDRSLRRHLEGQAAGRFVGQAERPGRRPSRVLEARPVRGLR